MVRYHDLYMKSKGGVFKNKRLLVEFIHKAKAEKMREKQLESEAEARRAKSKKQVCIYTEFRLHIFSMVSFHCSATRALLALISRPAPPWKRRLRQRLLSPRPRRHPLLPAAPLLPLPPLSLPPRSKLHFRKPNLRGCGLQLCSF